MAIISICSNPLSASVERATASRTASDIVRSWSCGCSIGHPSFIRSVGKTGVGLLRPNGCTSDLRGVEFTAISSKMLAVGRSFSGADLQILVLTAVSSCQWKVFGLILAKFSMTGSADGWAISCPSHPQAHLLNKA